MPGADCVSAVLAPNLVVLGHGYPDIKSRVMGSCQVAQGVNVLFSIPCRSGIESLFSCRPTGHANSKK